MLQILFSVIGIQGDSNQTVCIFQYPFAYHSTVLEFQYNLQLLIVLL